MDATAISESSTIQLAPDLHKDDRYHVFISYSSGDSIWVYGLIRKLEDTLPNLKICYHERDFVPGKTIIDNMVECIQSSQKTLVVLSPDFVRSRWCLFEANISVFRDCMVHKAIIPIMLKPCTVPLHLSHLTYLEAEDKQFFEKLTQVLMSENNQMSHSMLVHYQPSVLYDGKTILTLPAVNEGSEKWEPAIYSTASVPDQLRPLLDDSELYKNAIGIINDVRPSRSFLRFVTFKVFVCIALVLLMVLNFIVSLVSVATLRVLDGMMGHKVAAFVPNFMVSIFLMPTLLFKVLSWNRKMTKAIKKEMVLKTGHANVLLMESSLLVGCPSKNQLFFVYVSLRECRQAFDVAFGHRSELVTTMWEKALINYSSDYACCLARKHFPFNGAHPPGHLDQGMCFCQYVAELQRRTDTI
ncbi:uncharacterized protein LOC128469293 [Spea bombifrons]|uniref:uncharacterized protein LOC128469293 n=1 Tax=Spea bombifrons TaxID=233779 RepID=UPI00234B4E1F|nr:uncharacterized protein LOC128469293 [Spea bombifrons]